MNIQREEILELSKKFYPEIRDVRRHLHKFPELSFQEFETSGFIGSKLDEWGVSYRKGIVKTGIVAELEGRSSGRVIAFRADMDALPITENNDVPYASVHTGVMHACGHDVHTASLLGTIRVLKELKDHWAGRIKFVFQPGEERIPGGAKLMLEEKLFDGDEPELIVAQHVYPELEAGKIGFRSGQYMASSDEIYITITGKGGHAALPERLIDPVLIASHIVVALQQIVSRNNKPGTPTVLSFGKIEGQGAVNVIPDKVFLEGTFRTMDEEWRKQAHKNLESITKNIAFSMGGNAEVEIRHGYPVLYNDQELTNQLKNYAKEMLGPENVEDLDIRMTAEDFAYFSQKYPACLFRLGITPPGSQPAALHTPDFNVDESSIKLSMGLLSWMAVNLLG
jgi:amidohydrolase